MYIYIYIYIYIENGIMNYSPFVTLVLFCVSNNKESVVRTLTVVAQKIN